jgi:outer membrane protein OmpA-like peptidoglycan-associated protein
MYVSNNDLDKNRLKPIDTVLVSNIENQKDVENQNATSQKIQYQLDDFYDQNERLKKQNKQRAKASNNNLKQERKVERKNTVVPIIVPSEKDDSKAQTLIAAQNDTINRLKNQLKSQNPTDSLKIQKSLTTVPFIVQNRSIDSVANQNPMVRNDSIQGLKKNLVAAPKVIQFTTVDTVFVEKKVTEIQLKTIEPLTFITFYDLGKTEPNNNVLDEIIPILKAENVIKVELSGFTDSTGNAAFNKQLTDKRLNFVQSTIKQFVPIKNIFVQNFGQTFASQKSLNDDRKVEIRIYLKNEEKSIKN